MLSQHIGYIGCFSAFHTEVEIAKYLERAGHQVDRYHFSHLDQKAFLNRDFDMVICSVPQTFPTSFWREIESKKVAWYFDWISGWSSRTQEYLPRLQYFDLIVSTDGFENDIYEGLNRHWLPHAIDPEIYKPLRASVTSDCQFCGHVYTPYRKRLLRGLRERYNFSWVGGNEECWGPKYSIATNSTKIVIGDNCRNDIPGYWSDRLYLATACQGFVLYPNVPGIETQFTPGRHIEVWNDEDELYSKIDHYLSHDNERLTIAKLGCEHAHRYHTWQCRIKEFEAICDENL